jgi:hypothetical protein
MRCAILLLLLPVFLANCGGDDDLRPTAVSLDGGSATRTVSAPDELEPPTILGMWWSPAGLMGWEQEFADERWELTAQAGADTVMLESRHLDDSRARLLVDLRDPGRAKGVLTWSTAEGPKRLDYRVMYSGARPEVRVDGGSWVPAGAAPVVSATPAVEAVLAALLLDPEVFERWLTEVVTGHLGGYRIFDWCSAASLVAGGVAGLTGVGGVYAYGFGFACGIISLIELAAEYCEEHPDDCEFDGPPDGGSIGGIGCPECYERSSG